MKYETTEVWKPITGFENRYMVSNLGNVKSLDWTGLRKDGRTYRLKGHRLKTFKRSGYDYVHLQKDCKTINYAVHRLVATMFVSNPEKLPEVNHKDETRTNNVASNLEWCSHKQNGTYGTVIDRISEAKGIPVIGTDRYGKEYSFASSIKAAKALGVSKGAILNAVHGRSKTCAGMTWRKGV